MNAFVCIANHLISSETWEKSAQVNFLKANQVVQVRRASAICCLLSRVYSSLVWPLAFVLLLKSSGFSRKNFPRALKSSSRINRCLHSFSFRISSIIATSTQRLSRS